MHHHHLAEKYRREATVLAHVLLDWHRQFGVRLAHQRMQDDPKSISRYLQLVGDFCESDLSDMAKQVEIARQQLSGAFEWLYGEEIPSEILHRWARHADLDIEFPLRLNEAAGRILAINDELQNIGVPASIEGRTVVRYNDQEDLFAQARKVYQAFTAEEDDGIGGANFLLACSIERQERPRQSTPQNEITLIDDSVLGVVRAVPQSRPNDFLDLLRSKMLVIKTVGEPRNSHTVDHSLNREE